MTKRSAWFAWQFSSDLEQIEVEEIRGAVGKEGKRLAGLDMHHLDAILWSLSNVLRNRNG